MSSDFSPLILFSNFLLLHSTY